MKTEKLTDIKQETLMDLSPTEEYSKFKKSRKAQNILVEISLPNVNPSELKKVAQALKIRKLKVAEIREQILYLAFSNRWSLAKIKRETKKVVEDSILRKRKDNYNEKMVAKLTIENKVLSKDVKELKKTVNLLSNKTDKCFSKLEEHVENVEEKVNDFEIKVDRHADDIEDNKTKIAVMEKSAKSNQENVEKRFERNEEVIEHNSIKAAKNESGLKEQETTLGKLNDKIDISIDMLWQKLDGRMSRLEQSNDARDRTADNSNFRANGCIQMSNYSKSVSSLSSKRQRVQENNYSESYSRGSLSRSESTLRRKSVPRNSHKRNSQSLVSSDEMTTKLSFSYHQEFSRRSTKRSTSNWQTLKNYY